MSIQKPREIILLNIYGTDKPGLTSTLTQILAEYNVNILDIGQAVIHNNLDLGILFEVPQEAGTSPILKDLLFKGYELGIKIKFTPITEDDYDHWVSQQGKGRYIITVLGPKISAKQIAEVSNVIHHHGLNIDKISRLTGRVRLEEDNPRIRACIELSVRGTPLDTDGMSAQLLEVSRHMGVLIAFQQDNIYRRTRRLVCFDMDSSLLQTGVIEEMARRWGKGEADSAITEAAMRGELSFSESLTKRVLLLKGMDESVMIDVASKLSVTDGADRLFRSLRKYGFKTAILSGGISYFAKHLQNKLGIDYVFANELEVANGKLTGRIVGDIIDGPKKAELLRSIAFTEDIHFKQTVAVGEGVNDLPMINIAGLGIAFNAKPLVNTSAPGSTPSFGLDSLLFLLGFKDRDID